MTLVSTVVPTYNRAESLAATVDSVLAQTHEELEVIVVDDASEDDTAAVVESYDDPRVRFRQHDENRGGSAARNTGIEAAEGEYVAFLDSDDRWLPSKLERQLAALDSRGEGWVAAYCDVRPPTDGDTSRLAWFLGDLLGNVEPRAREGGDELIAEVLTDRLHTSAGSTLMVERAVAEAIGGFDESFVRLQDTEFLVRVLERGRLAHVPEALVVRDPAGHPSPEQAERATEQLVEAFADRVARLEWEGESVIGALHLILAKEHLAAGNLGEGLHYARSATPAPAQYPGLAWSLLQGLRTRYG